MEVGCGRRDAVIESTNRQSVVTKDRVALGKRKLRSLRPVLAEIERRYGVDGRVVLAIWGVETNFGGFLGGTSVIEALASLAYDGRRRNWAESSK